MKTFSKKTPQGFSSVASRDVGSLRLCAKDLSIKGGFCDGDLIVNLLIDLEEDHPDCSDVVRRADALNAPKDVLDENGYPGHSGDHKILVALVRKYLSPKLPGIEIEDFFSCHSPILAVSEEDRSFCANSKIEVEISISEFLETIHDLEVEHGVEASPSP